MFSKLEKATVRIQAQHSSLWMLPKSPKLFSHFHCSGRAERWKIIQFPSSEERLLYTVVHSDKTLSVALQAEICRHLEMGWNSLDVYHCVGSLTIELESQSSACWHRQHRERRELAKTDPISSWTKGTTQNKLNSKVLGNSGTPWHTSDRV